MLDDLSGWEALKRLMHEYQFETVLDIGSGKGAHADAFRQYGKSVTAIDIAPPADVVSDYMDWTPPEQFDAIWCCHVLEHQRNPGLFLEKVFADLKNGGVLAITVPPLKHQIVGGHVTLWNLGLLLYNLILAGFDCSEGRGARYGYNISVIVKKKRAKLPLLKRDYGDIGAINKFFPFWAQHGFDGDIQVIRW